MALTNRERQARWRERVKARASMPIAAAFREYARQLMSDDWINEGEDTADLALAAREAVLGKNDDELSVALDETLSRLFSAEFLRLAKVKRRYERSKHRRDESAVTNDDRPKDNA